MRGETPFLLNIEDLILNISATPAKLVVITGGEPLMYNLDELTANCSRKVLKPTLKHQVHIR